jgi:surface polysaccharide O-acyltransferase-like enzyme
MRASNIELLRIISMILIIMHHFSVHGCFPFTPDLTFNKVFLQVFGLGGKAGVVAFVMITGYFMISSSLKLHKFAKLVGQIWFYSIAMLGMAMGLGLDTVTSRNMMLALLPIGAMSWFAQNFLVLYLLTPIINRVLHWLQHTTLYS